MSHHDKHAKLNIDRRFDADKNRHYLNGEVAVLHCHHFTTLYTQLAIDAEIFDGKGVLRKSAELAFAPMLKELYRRHNATTLVERIELATQYWQFVGMGLVDFVEVGPISAVVHMPHSHADEGWIKKWGKRDKPVNFIGQGFIAAAMASFFDLPEGTYQVNEHESIVSGAERSLFTAVRG